MENDEPGLPPVKIPVAEAITRTVTKTKENIGVRRAFGISIEKGTTITPHPRMNRLTMITGVVGGYVHGGEGDNKAGRLGALVTVISDASDKTALTRIATQLAMHVVGLNPLCLDVDGPAVAEALTRARAKRPQATAADVAEDVALLEQKFFSGTGESVKEMLAKEGEKLGAPVRVHSFMRLAVGEGIEKKEDNFAQEVMGMIKQ